MKLLKTLLPIVLLFITLVSKAQKIDTIEVGYNKTVVLIFSTPVISDDIGSEDVLVAKEREMIKLAGAIDRFKETTLFVETEDGYYSYIIKYSSNPKKLSLFYPATKVTYAKGGGAVSSSNAKTVSVNNPNGSSGGNAKELGVDKDNNFYSKCDDIAHRSNSINDLGVLSSKLHLMLSDIYINNDNLFFKVTMKNNSNIDYDIELIRFVIKSKKGKIKQAAVQETILEPVYVYNGEKNEIQGKDGLIKVFCFKKFTFSEEKKLFIELWENGGERILSFNVPSERIINTKKL